MVVKMMVVVIVVMVMVVKMVKMIMMVMVVKMIMMVMTGDGGEDDNDDNDGDDYGGQSSPQGHFTPPRATQPPPLHPSVFTPRHFLATDAHQAVECCRGNDRRGAHYSVTNCNIRAAPGLHTSANTPYSSFECMLMSPFFFGIENLKLHAVFFFLLSG